MALCETLLPLFLVCLYDPLSSACIFDKRVPNPSLSHLIIVVFEVLKQLLAFHYLILGGWTTRTTLCWLLNVDTLCLGYIKNSKVCCLWRDPWQNGVGSNVFCWVAGIKLSFLDLVLILRFFLTEERSPNRTKISHVAAGENSRNISNKRKHHKTFLISSKWVLKLFEAKVDFFISGYF